MTWQTFLFILVAGGAFGYSGYRFSILIRLLKAQKGQANRLDQIPARIGTTILNVLGQKAVLQKKAVGIMHATIFWGFIIITIGTLEQFVSTLYAPANFEFIGHTAYSGLVFIQDILTVLVLAAVGYACYRRYIVRPEALGKSKDADLVLAFTASLMVAILLMNGFHILSASPWYQDSMPFSKMLAMILAGMGFGPGSSHVLWLVFKWIHMFLVLGFAMYIPGSKHLHVIAAGPNTFFKTIPREKGMRPINFEDEKVTQYGAAKVTDFSWKDTLDYYACTECGRCQEVCPAHNTQKPLNPKMLIKDLKENLYRNKEKVLAGKYDEVTSVIDENVTDDVIWACTSCRACEIACPVFIEHTDKIYDIRRNLVMMESRFPAEAQTIFKNMETNATPWAFSSADRGKWSEGLSVRTMAEDPKVDVLLWVGCAGSYDDRNKKVLRSFSTLLKKAGVKFAILGTEEQCTGDPARRIGNEYLFQTLAKANIETLNRYEVKRIVTACPHCFNSLKNEYKDFGGNYEVFHHSQYIAKLIGEGKLKPTKGVDETIAYHDSCYLGRWNNVYEDPRQSIQAIPSARLVEIKANHDKSMCCGAGGGRMFLEEKIGKRVNIARTEQALETKASIVAAACPFCMTMITDGVKAKEMSDKVRVMDIAELVDQATP
ncbi:4Fe-4S dicluster domain-containing protein [bacterium]|jgi:Fe-S oxidoreductase|nr:4Fe-4S dicluster domain-containing protein [bacterium]